MQSSSRLLSWSRYTFILGLVLALVFIIPSSWFPLQLGKVAVFAVFVSIAAILFVLSGGMRDFFKSAGCKAALLVTLLPLAYVASYFFSIDRTLGIYGYAMEGDTVLFMVLCALAFLFSFVLFKTPRTARVLLLVVSLAAGIAVLFQYVTVLFGTKALPFAIFSDRSVNLVGKWNDLGLLAGLLLLLLLVSMEFVDMTRMRRVVAGIFAAVLTLLLALIQFPIMWGILLGFSLFLAVWSFMSKNAKDTAPHGVLQVVPWVPLVGAFVSGIFLLWGATVNTGLVNVFPVSALEVRPSFNSTLDIARTSHGTSFERFLLGTGPQTFGQDWLMNKPVEVNQSPFWNLDFNVGISIFMTALVSVGVLGVLAWLVPLMLVLFGLLRALRSEHFSAGEKITVLCLATASVYLWCGILFYVPSQMIMLLAFVLGGAAFGLSMKNNVVAEEGSVHPSRVASLGFAVASLVFVLMALWSGVVTVRRFIAEAYTNQGVTLLGQGDADGALSRAEKAQQIESTSDASRLAVAARTAQLQKIAAQSSPTPALQAQFKTAVEKIIPEGKNLVAMGPADYRGYFALGKVYDILASVGVGGAYDSAKQSYLDAEARNPKSPEIPLFLSRLEAVHGSPVAAIETSLAKALTLKSDYTDAILFLVQLNVANKDIPNAIKAAQAAVRTAPGVPSIWFELGLLYYTAGDMANTASVLEQAVKLQPDYANAKYFLGLAYAAQGRTPDALQQFTDLQVTNPDNQEVQLILGNLRAGRPAFTNAQPPVTPTPQDRTTAPISQ